MSQGSDLSTAGEVGIDTVLGRGLVRTVFQPLVKLSTGRVVAAEALSRGPAGTALENPMALLTAAGEASRLAELDELMLTTAVATACARRSGPGLGLFVNVEPGAVRLRAVHAVERAVASGLQVVVELTERELARDLAAVLRAADAVRSVGARIAVDDVGADPMSLALISLLRPDVVKLDMRLIRDYAAGELAEVANAVRSYAEETGALVVAEGVETPADEDVALILGADLGQGWRYGRPAATLPDGAVPPLALPRVPGVAARPLTPYGAVAAVRPATVTTKRLLLPMSRTLEQRGARMVVPPLLLSAFQDARHFTPATAARYAALGATLPYVGAVAVGLGSAPAPGVRGGRLRSDDALAGEWSVVVLGAHFAAALAARDLGDVGPEPDRRFEYAITHDRDLVTAAAWALAARLSA